MKRHLVKRLDAFHSGKHVVTITREQVEDYRFLRLYSIDLEMAKQACDLLARQADVSVRYALLRDLVVTYARPFSTNRGRAHKRHKLLEEIVPTEMRPLHNELLTLRDQSFAHTDHDFRNPQISRWPKSDGGAIYGMGFNNPPYERLLARLTDIRALTVMVEKAVNARVRAFELDFNRLYPEEASAGTPGETTESPNQR